MSMLKRYSTAVALVLASSLPALAQDTEVVTLAVPEGFVAPEGSVVVQFAGTDSLFVAPYELAAELCQVSEGDFAAVAGSGVDVIYCEQLDEAEFTTFTETEGVESLVDRESGNSDEAAVTGDDAEESTEGADGGDSGEGDDGATGGDGTEGGDTGEGGVEEGDGDEGMGDDAGSEVDVEAGAEAEVDVDAGN